MPSSIQMEKPPRFRRKQMTIIYFKIRWIHCKLKWLKESAVCTHWLCVFRCKPSPKPLVSGHPSGTSQNSSALPTITKRLSLKAFQILCNLKSKFDATPGGWMCTKKVLIALSMLVHFRNFFGNKILNSTMTCQDNLMQPLGVDHTRKILIAFTCLWLLKLF